MLTTRKVRFKSVNGHTLTGTHYVGTTRKGIIFCHGFLSNEQSSGRFSRFASALQSAGYHVLTFNFSGFGGSEGEFRSIAHEVNDLKGAIHFLKAAGIQAFGAYGHSLGARVILSANSDAFSTIACSGAGTDSVSYKWSDHFHPEQLVHLREHGYLEEPIEKGECFTVRIHKQVFDDFELVNQKELLSALTVPVLFIHGNKGEEELMLSKLTVNGMQFTPASSEYVLIDGANHSFSGKLDHLEHSLVRWFSQSL